MSNADENREPESLELNKETLQDLDVAPNADAVKGGGGLGAIQSIGAYTPPTLGGYTPPTLKTGIGESLTCGAGLR